MVCSLPAPERLPISLGNLAFDGPNENIDQHEQISEREGHYICGLRRSPIWGMDVDENLDAPASSPIFGGDKATFTFANLECTIYPQGDRKDEQVASLQRAVRDLVAVMRQKG